MILEGLVTTVNEDGSVNIAPMGPRVDREFHRLSLRPFQSSRTSANLMRTHVGVFHVTDDVELIARAAIGQIEPMPRLIRASEMEGFIIEDACRWYGFDVLEVDDSRNRITMECRVVAWGRQRDFVGLNRAKHAVIEAAILATRLMFLDPRHVREQFDALAPLVEKTGGEGERRAFQLLEAYLAEQGKASR